MQRIAIVAAISLQLTALAAGMDSRTTDLLIKKFETVYLQIAPGDDTRTPVTLRLADLLAEKARRLSMEEMANGCVECNAGAAERGAALKYYQEVVGKLAEDKRGKVLSQMGHIFELNGQTEKALKLYKDVIVAEKDPALLGEVHLSMAELQFRRRDFTQAYSHYQSALKFPEFQRRGFASYRMAWSQFNLGNLDPAIAGLKEILNSPELLTRSGGVVSVDKQFQEEVSRDLATFISRKGVTMADVEMIFAQSPDNARMENVIYLASELERLGQAAPAVKVWRFLQEKQTDPVKRLEGHVRLAQLELTQGKRVESLREYEQALRLWTQIGDCSDGQCQEWKTRLKNYVVDWNREEKIKPSAELLETYEKYLSVFSGELDMTVWASLVAQTRAEWAKAFDLLGAAAKIRPTATPEQAKDMPSHESLLLSQVEIGEKSGSDDLFVRSLDGYLANSKEKTKFVDVRYQKAHRIYKKADYATAAPQLRDVALIAGNDSLSVKRQAADLALDSLVILKRDQDLEIWASEFAKAFPSKASEYLNISRRSVLNQTADLSAASSDLMGAQKAWDTLNRMNINGAEEAELAKYYKNKLILAEKLKNLDEVAKAIEKLIAIKTLSDDDRQLALSRQAWLAELKLDFKTALSTSEKLKMSEMKPDQRALKLAMYADLAGLGSERYYQEFLKASDDKEKQIAVATKLVRESKQPQKALDQFATTLKGNLATYAQLQYEIYLNTGDRKGALKRLAGKDLEKTGPAKALWREDFISRFEVAKAKLIEHPMKAESDKVLGNTLKARMSMIEGMENLLKESMAQEDWTTQMLTVQLLGQEANRFYGEILSLPMPDGLTPEQQNEYLQLLSQQAAPHQMRAQELTAKFNEFWTHEGLVASFQSKLPKYAGPERDKYLSELNLVASVAPEALKPQLAQIAAIPPDEKIIPSLAELEGARRLVRDNPFGRDQLESLLSLERKMGRVEMVAYLENRLAKLAEPQIDTPKSEEK